MFVGYSRTNRVGKHTKYRVALAVDTEKNAVMSSESLQVNTSILAAVPSVLDRIIDSHGSMLRRAVPRASRLPRTSRAPGNREHPPRHTQILPRVCPSKSSRWVILSKPRLACRPRMTSFSAHPNLYDSSILEAVGAYGHTLDGALRHDRDMDMGL